jgi:glycine/D-amino acid oxidase-like deaminating enzyme
MATGAMDTEGAQTGSGETSGAGGTLATNVNLNTFAPRHTVVPGRPEAWPRIEKGSRVVVIGAGCFGGWAALWLQRRGAKVTLVDAWGAGNSRSSSGDETRVIRSTYGANETYFDLNVRALELWKEHEPLFGKQIFFNQGVLWLCYEEKTSLVDESIPFADKHQASYEYISAQELGSRYPVIRSNDLHHAYLDRAGGYLKARESAAAVLELFVRNGGQYLQEAVKPPSLADGSLKKVILNSGKEIEGDVFLFACGSWLGQVFPEVLSRVITCTRQEVYYFGTPSASGFDDLPVWVDVDGRDFYYGIPGNAGRGFKVGVDIRGEPFDPTSGDHLYSADVLSKARAFLGHRFPALAAAPLLESRVCPYENSPDGNFLFDHHPNANNVIFLGGGSGHGFKHGPALGELVADVLSGTKQRPALFALQKTP